MSYMGSAFLEVTLMVSPTCISASHSPFSFIFQFKWQHYSNGICAAGTRDSRHSVSQWTPGKCSGDGALDVEITGWTLRQEFIHSASTKWVSLCMRWAWGQVRSITSFPGSVGFSSKAELTVCHPWSLCFIVPTTTLSLLSGLFDACGFFAWLVTIDGFLIAGVNFLKT